MPVIEEQVPKHIQLREILRGKIVNEHKHGERLDSEPQLMKKYNISNTTVQKAISTLVQEGLITRIQGKGTFVNRLSTLNRCNIVIPKDAFHEHSYYFDVIRGIEIVTSEAKIDVAIQTYSAEISGFSLEKFVKRLMSNPSSGMVIIPPPDCNEIVSLLKYNRPFVVIGNYPQYPEIYTIGIDTYNGAFQMAEYLIKKGHKKIALVGGLYGKSNSETDFLRGYKEAFTSHNIPVRGDWIMESKWLEEEGYRLTKILLQSKERPTAIFAGDDTIAVGVIKALTEASIKIPDEIVVVGFNDLDLATIVSPNLTTMRVPRLDIGKAACGMLLKLAHNQEIPQKQISFKTELVIRDSA